MSSLYRRSKLLKFDDSEITVRELEVSVLLRSQRGEIELTDEVLLQECAGLQRDEIGLNAYNEIMSAIDAMHKDLFEEPKEGTKPSKKNSPS